MWEVLQNSCNLLNDWNVYLLCVLEAEGTHPLCLEANLEAQWLSIGFELLTVKRLAPRYGGYVS
jgi:hypothetical protein